MKKNLIIISLFLLVGISAVAVPQGLLAQTASAWVENDYVRTRMISSVSNVSPDAGSEILIGWQIELKKEGWKTYWRSPGDAGLPPVFTWEGSLNLAKAEVQFPMPERFEIFDIETFGYEHSVILPIAIAPHIGGAAMTVKSNASFMACKDVCIPFTADYVLDLPAGNIQNIDSEFYRRIMDAAKQIPLRAEALNVLSVDALAVRGNAGQQVLDITLKGNQLLTGADVIVELPEQFRFKKAQKIILDDGKKAQFFIPIVNLREGLDLHGQDIVLTVKDGWGNAFEKHVTIDILN